MADDPNDLTGLIFGTGVDPPANIADLRADPSFGDGVFAGDPFEPWQYVRLMDGTRWHYGELVLMWLAGVTSPTTPDEGSIIADLPTLRSFVGASSTVDDERLQAALDASSEYVYERTMPCVWTHPDVQHGIVMLASRLFKRRQSPEGTSGFGGDGVIVRIMANDPDVRALLERHLDMLRLGVG